MDTTCDPAARDWRMVAVVAEPEEKARAYLACSRAATAVSKLSLDHLLAEENQRAFYEAIPVGIGASSVLILSHWLPHCSLSKCG